MKVIITYPVYYTAGGGGGGGGGEGYIGGGTRGVGVQQG